MTMLDVTTLKAVAESNATSKAIFGELSTRQRSRHRINLRKFKYDLLTNGNKVIDEEYVETFKKLQEMGVGKLISGRHGNPSRFVWSYKLKDIAQAAQSGEAIIMPEVKQKKTRKPYTKRKIESKVPVETVRQVAQSTISLVFNFSTDTRMEDLAALVSLAKELEKK